MPSEKSERVSLRKSQYNRNVRSAVKTYVVAARRAIGAGSVEEAQPTVARAASALDRAAKRGTLHRNNASRRKSRLDKSLQRLGQQQE